MGELRTNFAKVPENLHKFYKIAGMLPENLMKLKQKNGKIENMEHDSLNVGMFMPPEFIDPKYFRFFDLNEEACNVFNKQYKKFTDGDE